ncbi:MAG: chemotaxis protein CheW, partial [Caulobacteraceae bacterium]
MAGEESALLAFRIGDRRFAVDASRVAEVARRPPVTRVPHAPPSLAGVAALRGRVLPVVTLGALLDVRSEEGGRLIVLGGGEPIGLAVDEVIGLETGAGGGLVETVDGAARVLALEEMLARAFADGFRRRALRRTPDPAPTSESADAADRTALLAFSLAGQPYALPLDVVREVIATPAELAALPRTDAAMLGVVALRGALTPVVSTRVLLGLAPAPLTEAGRIVVAHIGAARVGFAVDRVSAIVHAPTSAIGPVPKVLNRGAGEARVAAMLRTGTGGLVSVLDPEQLFAEESVAQILEDGRRADEDADGPTEGAAFQRILIFEVGAETYGLDIAAVEEVTTLPQRLSRVPRAPAYV